MIGVHIWKRTEERGATYDFFQLKLKQEPLYKFRSGPIGKPELNEPCVVLLNEGLDNVSDKLGDASELEFIVHDGAR